MNGNAVVDMPGLPVNSTAKERSHILATYAVRLLNAKISNLSAGALFAQVHNKASAVANADVPLFTVPIPALGFAELSGFTCSAGCVLALSTASDSYADPGANGWFYGEVA